MKKYLPFIESITLGASAFGVLLRFWFLRVGADEKGLYPAGHISWILLIILSCLFIVVLFLLAGYAGKNRFYAPNFPASITGAAGFAAGAAGLFVAGSRDLITAGIKLYRIAGVIGILAGVAMLLGGWCRLKGKKPHFIVFMLPCAYLALRLFCMGHAWGDEPEYSRFIFAFLATAGLLLSCYHLWAFCVDMGQRSMSLFIGLLAFYLCIVSVVGNADSFFYLAMALWLFTNLCPNKKPALPVSPAPQEPQPEAPAAEEPAAPTEPAPAVNSEVDAIIAEILRETAQEKE